MPLPLSPPSVHERSRRQKKAELEWRLKQTQEAQGRVAQLREQVASLGKGCGLSPLEHRTIAHYSKKLNVHDEEILLNSIVESLETVIITARQTNALIQRREQLLDVLNQDMGDFSDGSISEQEFRNRSTVNGQLLIELTVSIVKTISVWRESFTQPLPLMYQGKNYLLKVLEDAHHFSSQTSVCSILGIPFSMENPLGGKSPATGFASTTGFATALVPLGGSTERASSANAHYFERTGSAGPPPIRVSSAMDGSVQSRKSSVVSFSGHGTAPLQRETAPKPKKTKGSKHGGGGKKGNADPDTTAADQAQSLLASCGTFPYSVPATSIPKAGAFDHSQQTGSDSSATGPFDAKMMNSILECEKVVLDEYAAQVKLWKTKIMCCERGVFVPTLQVLLERGGPLSLNAGTATKEHKEAVMCFRLFAHTYTVARKKELGLLPPPVAKVVDVSAMISGSFSRRSNGAFGIPHLAYDEKSTPTFTQLPRAVCACVAAAFIKRYFDKLSSKIMLRRRNEALAVSLAQLTTQHKIRVRLNEWSRFVLMKRRQRHREEVLQKQKEDRRKRLVAGRASHQTAATSTNAQEEPSFAMENTTGSAGFPSQAVAANSSSTQVESPSMCISTQTVDMENAARQKRSNKHRLSRFMAPGAPPQLYDYNGRRIRPASSPSAASQVGSENSSSSLQYGGFVTSVSYSYNGESGHQQPAAE